ncbi:MAG: hypothetical protein WC516_01235 [Patescibacteria group bacterium]
MKKSFYFVAIFILASVLIAGSAQAVGLGTARIKSSTTATTTVTNGLSTSSTAAERCSIIQSRLETRIASYEVNKEKYLKIYFDLKNRLINIQSNLENRGLDTSDIKFDLVTLDQKISKFSLDYQTYAAKLKEAGTFVCGKSQGQFLGKIREARVLLLNVKKDALDIKSFYLSAIKTDLGKLKTQIKQQSSSSTVATTTTGNIFVPTAN